MSRFDELITKQKEKLNITVPLQEENIVENKFVLQEKDKVIFDEKNVSKHLISQRRFYQDYNKEWKEPYSGYKVYKSEYSDPTELHNENLNARYMNKNALKVKAVSSSTKWSEGMSKYGGDRFGIRFNQSHVTAFSHDIMAGTLRYAFIQQAKYDIVQRTLKELEEKNIIVSTENFERYLPQILALGPSLKAEIPAGSKDYKITEDSEEEFKNYIINAAQDPATVIKEQVNDAVLAYGRFPTHLLNSKSMAAHFDEAKQLRDKYKAIHTLMINESVDDDIYDQLNVLRKDKELKANIQMGTEVYRRLDADLYYTLKSNGLECKSNFLDVIHDTSLRHYVSKDGELTKQGFLDLYYNMDRTEKAEYEVSSYWLDTIKAEIQKKDLQKKKPEKEPEKEENKDKKEEKKEEPEFKDEYNIAREATSIAGSAGDIDVQKKDLLDEISSITIGLAQDLEVIGRELEKARAVEKDNAQKNSLRPEVKKRLRWYIRQRENQLLDLLDRAAGYLNAMRYLTGKEELNQNGKKLLDETQKDLLKEELKIEDYETDGEAMISEKSNEALRKIVGMPETFGQFKKRILEKIKGKKEYALLANALESKNASVTFDMLIIKGHDLETMSVDDIQNEFTIPMNENAQKDLYVEQSRELAKEMDTLYERIATKDLFLMPESDIKQVADLFYRLKRKQYALNRLNVHTDDNGQPFYETARHRDQLKYNPYELYKKRLMLSKFKFEYVSDALRKYRNHKLGKMIGSGIATQDLLLDSEKAELAQLVKVARSGKNAAKDENMPRNVMVRFFENATEKAAINMAMHSTTVQNYSSKEENEDLHTFETSAAVLKDRRERIALEDDKYQKRLEKEKEDTQNAINLKKERRSKARAEKVLKQQKEMEKKQEEQKRREQEKAERERIRKLRQERNDFINLPKILHTDPENHIAYEKQIEGSHCWAAALSGLLNYKAGKQVSSIDMISKIKIPTFEESGMTDRQKYDDIRKEVEEMLSGKSIASPLMLGDFILQQMPGTVIKSMQIGYKDNKKEECKGIVRSKLRERLEKGPVAVLRGKHFVTAYGIEGDYLLVKDSNRTSADGSPDDILPDKISIDDYVENMRDGQGIQIVWLENLSGQEKEIADRFKDDMTYDEKKKEFTAVKKDEERVKGPDTFLHKDGIEGFWTEDGEATINYSVYVPKNANSGIKT